MKLFDYINSGDNSQRLENGEYAITDSELLATAQSHEVVKLWRIQGQVRKTQVQTAVIVYDTIERLRTIFTDPDESSEKTSLAKAVYNALNNLYAVEFYINLADATVSAMLSEAERLGVLIAQEIEAIKEAATYRTKPFEKVTLEQIREVRYPPAWREVSVESGNDQVVVPESGLISASNSGSFRFTLTTRKAFDGQIYIRIYAKKSESDVFTLQDSYPISVNKHWEANTAYAHVFKRVSGLAGYRYFNFEYIEPFSGALESVEVEGVV